jgi:MFS family permease
VLLGFYLPTVAMSVGQGMVSPAIPLLGAAFGVSLGIASQVVTATSVGRIFILGPAGLVVDRLGTRKMMILGAAISVAGTVLASFTGNFLVLLLAMVLLGGGNSVWMLGREIAAVQMVGPAMRGRILSSLFGVSVAGQAFGPVVGGFLAETNGYQAVFEGYLVLAASILVIGVFSKETQPDRRRRSSGPSERFTFRLLDYVDPYFRLTFYVLFAATFGAMLRNAALNSVLPLYGSVERGLSPLQVGTLFGIIGVANLAMIGPVGFITDRWGRKAAIVPSAVFTALGFMLYPFAISMPELMAVTVITGIGSGLALGSMTVSTYDIVPESHRGIFQSIRRGVGETGALLGPTLSGFLTDTYAPSASFFLLAPFYVVIALLAIFVARETHPLRRPGAVARAHDA